MHTAPRFIARDADGRVLAEKSWGEGPPLGHDGAVAHLAAFLRSMAPATNCARWGTAWCTAVRITPARCGSIATCSPRSKSSSRWRHCTSRTTWRRSGCCWSAGRSCPRSPASTRRSMPPTPTSRSASRSPPSCTTPACAATAFTDSPTSTWLRCCPQSTRARRAARSWCATWATAPACAPSTVARASPARWGSPRSTACRWGPARARSMPACCCT